MVKKGKVVTSEKIEMTPLLMDTTCSKEGVTSTWEDMHNILKEEQLRIMETKVIVNGRDSSDNSMLEMACLFLHHIATQPKIIPYTDMVKWVIDEANISYREFKTRSQEVMGSFTMDNLQFMYLLPEPQVIYNRKFVEKFAKEKDNLMDYTHSWLNNEDKIKKDKNGMSSTSFVCPPYSFATAMLCRLFGRLDSTMFSP